MLQFFKEETLDIYFWNIDTQDQIESLLVFYVSIGNGDAKQGHQEL